MEMVIVVLIHFGTRPILVILNIINKKATLMVAYKTYDIF